MEAAILLSVFCKHHFVRFLRFPLVESELFSTDEIAGGSLKNCTRH